MKVPARIFIVLLTVYAATLFCGTDAIEESFVAYAQNETLLHTGTSSHYQQEAIIPCNISSTRVSENSQNLKTNSLSSKVHSPQDKGRWLCNLYHGCPKFRIFSLHSEEYLRFLHILII